MKKVIIDDVEYTPDTPKGDVKIVILQRGWVFVGYYSQDGEHGVLEKAMCIRIWGTTKGLGEIAANGPTDSTKLDAHGTVRFHDLTTIAIISCEEKKWISVLS